MNSCVGLSLLLWCSIAFAQEGPTAKVDSKLEYKLVRSLATASESNFQPFADAKPHNVIDIVSLKNGREIVVSEGDHLDSGVIYKVDLDTRWRGAHFENSFGFCSLVSVPSRNEVISSSWDSKIRFHDADSLQPKTSIPVNLSGSRMGLTPDESTLAIVNEGHVNADVSDGRSLWSVDVNSRNQKSILGTVAFRGYSISYSPDGKALALCGGLFQKASGTISIWDVATATQKFEVGLPSCFFKLAFTSDGKWLVATGISGTVTVNMQQGQQHANSPVRGRTLHVLPDSDAVLIADLGNTVSLLSLPDLKTLKKIPSESGAISAIASLGDDKSFVTGTRLGLQRWDRLNWSSQELIPGRIPVTNGFSPVVMAKSNQIAVNRGKDLLLCDAVSGQLKNSHAFETNIVKSAGDQNSNRVGVILDDRTVHAVDVVTGHTEKLGQIPVGTLSALTRDLSAAVFVSPDGELIHFQLKNRETRVAPTKISGAITHLVIANSGEVCCAAASGDVIIFDGGMNRMIHQIPKAAVESIACLDWSSQQQRLVIAEKKGRLSLFECDSKGEYQTLIRQDLKSPPSAVAISAVSGLIAVGHSDGTVSLISPHNSATNKVVPARFVGATKSCLFLQNDTGLVCSSGDSGLLSCVQLKTQPIPSTYRIEKRENQTIQSACLTPSGDECFIAMGESIEIRSTKTWETTDVLGGHRDVIKRVRLSGDGQLLASTGKDGIVIVRKKNGSEWKINSVVFLPGRGYRMEWSPDGRWLLVGTEDRKICVVDVTNWEIARTFAVPFVPNTFGFSADGRVLASSGNAGDAATICTFLVWDTTGWRQSVWKAPKTFHGHLHGVEAIAVTDDGQKFYSVGADSEMLEWTTASGIANRIRALPMSGTSLSLLPNQHYAVVSWHFASLAVLDVTDGSVVLPTEGHANDGENVLMHDVVLSQNGEWAVSCAAADLWRGGSSVRLWRIGKWERSRE